MWRAARVAAVAVVVFVAVWVGYRHLFGNDRLRTLRWVDLSARVAPLTFPHGTTRFLPGPKTFALYLRLHGFHGRPPRVDFHRRDVVLVASGPRSTTGYRLRVVSVVEQRSRVLVTLREETPRLGDPVRVETTYPFVLFTLPHTNKAKLVHIQGRP